MSTASYNDAGNFVGILICTYTLCERGAPVFEAPSASAREVGHLKAGCCIACSHQFATPTCKAGEEVSLDEVRIEGDGRMGKT